MNILLVNDDGIRAPGIAALRRACRRAGHRIWMVAPDRERSASGHAITLDSPLYVEEVAFDDDGGPGYSVSGTPADCAKLGIRAICAEPPDLVLSGINRGPNLGTDVLYSGTVSAAIEAVIMGVPSIALSLAGYANLDYDSAAAYALRLVNVYTKQGLPVDTMINVNIPDVPWTEVAGTRVTRLGDRRYRNVFERHNDEQKRVNYLLLEETLDNVDNPETDVWAIGQNYVSLTPMQLDLTSHSLLRSLTPWADALR